MKPSYHEYRESVRREIDGCLKDIQVFTSLIQDAKICIATFEAGERERKRAVREAQRELAGWRAFRRDAESIIRENQERLERTRESLERLSATKDGLVSHRKDTLENMTAGERQRYLLARVEALLGQVEALRGEG